MGYITRSQWYRAKIECFLEGSDSMTALALYPSEVKRIRKHFPKIMVEVGPLMKVTFTDQRRSCIIKRKND